MERRTDMSGTPYPRDLIGYGRSPPHPRWPNGARIALQFVLNHEEGAENNVLHGDAGSETFLSEIIGAQSFPARHMSMESLYEYGPRAGLRWISYQQVDEATERAHVAEATAILRELCGNGPVGWYTGRDSPNTRRLV